MADQEDLSPTLKTPRISPEQVQADAIAPASELTSTRKAPVVNRPPLPIGTAVDIPSVTAQPTPWWLQASSASAEATSIPAATDPISEELAGSDPASFSIGDAVDEPDDAATGPVPAVAITPDPSIIPEVDRYASSYEEYATNAFAAVIDAPSVAEPAAPAPISAPPPPPWVVALQQADYVNQREPDLPTEPADEENDMPQMQWEYCRVQLDSGSYTKSQNVGRYPYYVRVAVDYYGAEVPPTVTFSEDTDALDRPHKIWGQILGQLGLANWEMINIYTGTAKDYALVNVMAYFKRTVQPDRRVAEPKLTV